MHIYTIAVRDAIWTKGSGLSCSNTLSGTYTACTNYGVGTAGNGTPFYDIATSIDPNNHVSKSFSDALGRVAYTKEFSGVATGTLTANEETSIQYNVLNEPTQVVATDLSPQSGQTVTSATTTATYDALGRLTQLVDPDRGTHTYTYDANGQMLTDTSGTRTLGYNYDLLGRLGCLQDAAPTINATGNCTNGTNPYVQNTYDVSAPGSPWKGSGNDNPVGRLTQSIATTYYPDGTNATSTQNVEYDQRGRPITNQLLVNVPTSWGVGTLPTYQATIGYNDDDQPGTTQTSTILNGTSTPGYTVTEVYDPTSGVLNGLGTIANTPTANLASQVENANALPDTLTFYTSAGQTSKLAKDQFTYDGDLRPSEATATWQAGSGTTGQIFDQQRSYDAGSNVISLTTTLSSVPGQNNSGGSETQNFCYDEQNRLVWAGNSGTQPSPGNGTCGSGTLSNTLGGAAYNNSFVYTHLGQLWQGPLNGSSTTYQYLYCNSATPHQLTGMFPIGTTCSNQTGAVYTSSYDAWGNVTGRTYNNATATLSYDLLDQLVEWNAGSTSKEWYAYDATGNRTVRRATTGSSTTVTVYAFGGEEYTYSSSGTLQNATHYYSLGGRLIGELTGLSSPSTNVFLTDALGSVLVAFSNTQGSAAVLANQVYSPYGTQQYSAGTMSGYTTKGFTGQYADATGLDYYNARYYDPIAGVFLSADPVEGNLQGMNPYGYVNGNPETLADPTGKMYVPPPSGGGNGSPPSPPPQPPPPPPPSGGGWNIWGSISSFANTTINVVKTVGDATLGISSMVGDVQTIFNGNASWQDKLWAGADLLVNAGMDIMMVAGVGEEARAVYEAGKVGISLLMHGAEEMSLHEGEDLLSHAGEEEATHLAESGGCSGGLSFIASTLVATARGEQAIGTMHVGEKVLAYNPKSHKMELEPVLHVWINHDTDLVDLTLTRTTHAPHSAVLHKTSEVLHTNQKHPFLTKEKGFVPVSHLKLGMHVLEANGIYGVVTGWKIVPGAKTMYNLEVAQDHTYTVGLGEWVVHNDCGGVFTKLREAGYTIGKHFEETFTARAKGLTADDVTGILKDGTHLYDTKESNLVAVDEVQGKGLFRIAYDSANPRNLLSIAGKSNVAADILSNTKRYVVPWTIIPNWTNPFR